MTVNNEWERQPYVILGLRLTGYNLEWDRDIKHHLISSEGLENSIFYHKWILRQNKIGVNNFQKVGCLFLQFVIALLNTNC